MGTRLRCTLLVCLLVILPGAAAASSVIPVNTPPTAILLDAGGTVAENSPGADVATFRVQDPDPGDRSSLTVDDTRFELVVAGADTWTLRLKAAQALDFESEPGIPLTLTAVDQEGGTLSKTEWIVVENAGDAPSAIILAGRIIDRFITAGGQLVGHLSARDPDAVDAHVFSTAGDGRFEVREGNELWLIDTGLVGPSEYTIDVTVSATDSFGLGTSAPVRLLAPPLAPLNPPPTGISLDNASVGENQPGAVIGNLTVDDPFDVHTFLVNDDRFEITGALLKLRSGVSVDAEREQSILLRIAATDSAWSSIEAPFAISVEGSNEQPTRVWLSDPNVDSYVVGDIVATLQALDPDSGDTVGFSVGGGGARFEVAGAVLKLLDTAAIDRLAEPSIHVTITATDGGGLSVSQTFTLGARGVVPRPDPFVFTDQTGVPLSVLRTSNGITVNGISGPAPISVTGGSYSADGGQTFTAARGMVNNGDTVMVQHVSAADFSTTTDTVLVIGDVTDTFSTTTVADPSSARGIPVSRTAVVMLAGLLAALGAAALRRGMS